MLKKEVVDNLRIICDYSKVKTELKPSDIIICCGCRGTSSAYKVAELLHDNYSKYAILSGGYGKVTKDYYNKTEAEVYRDIIVKSGIDESRLILEDKSTNTGENFIFSKQLLDKLGLKYDSIIVVHEPFYSRRTLNTAKLHFPNSKIYITYKDIDFDTLIDKYNNIADDKILDDNISQLAANIERFIEYPKMGFMLYEDVPDYVVNAAKKIRLLGYNKFKIK